MQGEAALEWNPDQRRMPEPPVTTRRMHSDAPDPGGTSGLLPPFMPGRPDAGPHADVIEVLEPTAATPVEPTADVEVEPIADIVLESAAVPLGSAPDMPDQPDGPLGSTADAPAEAADDIAVDPTDDVAVEPTADLVLDAETPPEPDAFITATASETEPALDAEIEEAWLLDEIVEVDEEPHDALGEALQEAVARAAPPFAEELVRSGEQDDEVVIHEPRVSAAPPGGLPEQVEVGTGDAEIAGALYGPAAANPSTDGFTVGLAATLESLAGSLRARGINALDDAFARGDRLEASLALFLAGYRAGRGEE